MPQTRNMAETETSNAPMPTFTTVLQSIHPTPLPTFRGEEEGEDCGSFVEAARRAIRSFNIPQEMAAEWVIGALQGPARREVLGRPADQRRTGEEVLSIISETFQTPYNVLDRLRRFHSRRQGARETILDYAHSLSSLACQANHAQSDAVPAWALTEKFIDGLTSSALRFHLKQVRNGRDFLSLRNEARSWVRENPEDPSSAQLILSQQVEELRLTVAALKARLDDVNTPCQPPAPAVWGETPASAPSSPASSAWRKVPQPAPSNDRLTHEHSKYQWERRNKPSSFRRRCYWCDLPGHIEARCFAKQRYRRRKEAAHRFQRKRYQPMSSSTSTQTEHMDGSTTDIIDHLPSTSTVDVNSVSVEALVDTCSEMSTVNAAWVKDQSTGVPPPPPKSVSPARNQQTTDQHSNSTQANRNRRHQSPPQREFLRPGDHVVLRSSLMKRTKMQPANLPQKFVVVRQLRRNAYVVRLINGDAIRIRSYNELKLVPKSYTPPDPPKKSPPSSPPLP